MVVQRTQRMQRGAPIALGLAGAEDHQYLGAVQRQQPDGDAGAGAQRFERLGVLADPLGQLTTGQRGVAEEQHRPVLVALERAYQ